MNKAQEMRILSEKAFEAISVETLHADLLGYIAKKASVGKTTTYIRVDTLPVKKGIRIEELLDRLNEDGFFIETISLGRKAVNPRVIRYKISW
jgi:hypothetical protein